MNTHTQEALPEQIRTYLESLYNNGPLTILEYGSGGSTLLALRSHYANRVFSAETSSEFLKSIIHGARLINAQDRLTPIYCDIGKTKEWGYPDFSCHDANPILLSKFLGYSIKPWQTLKERRVSPSIILIDGRFRVGTFITAVALAPIGTRILFDDYSDRPRYFAVEEIAKPVRMIGRMAEFIVPAHRLQLDTLLLHYLTKYGDPV